jgi:hypothetical protein
VAWWRMSSYPKDENVECNGPCPDSDLSQALLDLLGLKLSPLLLVFHDQIGGLNVGAKF